MDAQSVRYTGTSQCVGGFDFSFIELFCGIGGFRIGLEKAGGRCVFSSEVRTSKIAFAATRCRWRLLLMFAAVVCYWCLLLPLLLAFVAVFFACSWLLRSVTAPYNHA